MPLETVIAYCMWGPIVTITKQLSFRYEILDRESIQWFWIVFLKSLSQQKQTEWDWGSLFAA